MAKRSAERGTLTETDTASRWLGYKMYELKDHLGNVRVVLGDKKTRTTGTNPFQPDVVSYSGYFPFGMQMQEDSYSGNTYRYGYNGQEMDKDINSEGNITTAEFWEYDARLGRRWNQDPKPDASISNYATFNNSPIMYSDVLGDSSVWDNKGYAIHYDENDKDLRAFMQDGDKLVFIGTLGGNIDATIWATNLLKENALDAKQNVWTLVAGEGSFYNRVKKGGIWDYKYRGVSTGSDENLTAKWRPHIIGAAFQRSDKDSKNRGIGDLDETHFSFSDGSLMGSHLRPEDLNNIHFGVVGKAYGLGITEFQLLALPGAVEIYKQATEHGRFIPSWLKTMGDNPIDHAMIKMGFLYFDRNKSSFGKLFQEKELPIELLLK
ncbi:MAG: hypothetical protein JST20_04815 [Bacteroidetes bacterium]|nr:hypothetical protein [Bacteroidota bacterium]